MGELEPIQNRNWTNEQITKALLALVMFEGSPSKASDYLKTQGITVSTSLLSNWKTTYPEHYRQMWLDHGPKFEEHAASLALELTIRLSELELQLAERVQRDLDQDKIREPARSLKDITTAKAINATKRLELTGRPTQVVEHRSATEIINRLRAMGVVEGTAEEVPTSPNENEKSPD